MPQSHELYVRPPPNYLRRFFFLLFAFISIVFYNTLDLIQELERHHRDAQVRSPRRVFEVTTTPSVEVIRCTLAPYGHVSAQCRPCGQGTFHECSASDDTSVVDVADLETLLRGVLNPPPSTTSSSSMAPSATIPAPLLTLFS